VTAEGEFTPPILFNNSLSYYVEEIPCTKTWLKVRSGTMRMCSRFSSGRSSCSSLTGTLRFHLLLSLVALIAAACPAAALVRSDVDQLEKLKGLQRILVWDGSGIHTVGRLQMHVTNWGAFGSYPDDNWPTSEYPSAQWPANSGVEYLYIAGLWVGAKRNGIPVVSTAAFDSGEFMPSNDPIDKIYVAFEGMPAGARLPNPADDDRDGRIDEDRLNGRDDDGDGMIDEDFVAIGKQMFSCEFSDYDPKTVLISAEHTPLGLFVHQESYQWEEERYANFVGVEYRMENRSADAIEEVYIGFMADGDVGPRVLDNRYEDDLTAPYEGVVCARRGEREVPVRVSIAYFYDDDGDEGRSPGYFGVLFLGHDTDPMGDNAPRLVGITSYQAFAGQQPYESGGDPTNDFQRYELMSKGGKDRAQEVPRDYRMLMSTGPFNTLDPDSALVLQLAFVIGNGLDGMLESAANAALAFAGNWFDIDGNPQTGTLGRETPLYGPAIGIVPDSCDDEWEVLSALKGQIIWINADCREEEALWLGLDCRKGDATENDYKTGVDGKETQINWLVGSAPPPPNLRVIPGDGKVTLLWDNFSEVTPDVSTLEYDFEGYRIWRADGWTRPFGTDVFTGPPRELWQLLEERDYADNAVSPNIEFRIPYNENNPDEGGWQYKPHFDLQDVDEIIQMFEESVLYAPLDTVPCPPGLTNEECDTLEAIARYNLRFEDGRQYYKFVDRTVHNGMHYFYSVTAYDHVLVGGVPERPGAYGDPSSNFIYVNPLSDAQQDPDTFDGNKVYVVPNPATTETMGPWRLEPNQDDPTGIKVEFRNLPACVSTVRIYTVSGDIVEVLHHDGSSGTLPWDLVSRNGQDVTSGIYLFSVEPEDDRFPRTIGKFVVIR
jgi:hypothetical protein